MIRGDNPDITLTTDELRHIIADCIDQIIQIRSPDQPDEVPTKEAYSLEEMNRRMEVYENLEMSRSAGFIREVIEEIHGDE